MNTKEKRLAYSCVIFDSDNQRTHCKEALKDTLNLKLICTDLIARKRFATEEGVLKEVDVVQICLNSKTRSANVYIEALSSIFMFV